MRRVILIASLAFAGLSSYVQASGFRLGADVLFGGQTKVDLSGLHSATGSATNTEYKVDNDAGFMIDGSYVYDFNDRFSGFLGLAFTTQETSGKVNAAITTLGNSLVSTDNGTVTTSSFDIRLGVQVGLMKDFTLGVALTLPLSANINGSLDNETGKDDYKLAGGVGVDFDLGYSFSKSFSANLGYSFLNTDDSDGKGGNNKDLSVASAVDRWKFGVSYIF